MKIQAPADAIVSFRDEFFFLSNMFLCPITLWGETFATSEHAYQCAKFPEGEFRDRVKGASTPKSAKWLASRLGRPHRLDGHAERRFELMVEIIRAKFSSPAMAEKLLATGDGVLIEGNTWGDRRWGCVQAKDGTWRGRNWLGEILMQVRSELRDSAQNRVIGSCHAAK
jgi:hypothetical protein